MNGSTMIDHIRHVLPAREVRTIRGGAELRASAGAPKIGLTIPFNSASADMGFTEFIDPGAFDETLQDGDCVALWNHDPNWVLGRQSNRTLAITKRAAGLDATVTLDPRNAMHMGTFAPCVARGDVAGSSFGFEVQPNGDRWDEKADGSVTRVLLRVKLFDISAVTFPAYPQSQAEARALIAGLLGDRMSRSVAHRMMTLRRRRLEMFERTLAR